MSEQDIDLEFGDYVSIEQHRYGADNEMYLHKVIGTFLSNTFIDVPEVSGISETHHNSIEEIVLCICCGVDETRAFKYRVKDVVKSQKLSRSSEIDSLLVQLGRAHEQLEALRKQTQYLSGEIEVLRQSIKV